MKSSVENAADNEANIAWVRESFNLSSPYSTGITYTNFTGQVDETAGALATRHTVQTRLG